MNYIYFYYCDDECDYTQVVKLTKEEEEVQCKRCATIQGIKKKYQTKIICTYCNNREVIKGDAIFKDGYECKKCGSKGEVGFEDVHDEYDIMFKMEIEKDLSDFECIQCKSKEAFTKPEDGWKCPDCDKRLKEKLSTYWEEKEKRNSEN